VRVISAATLGKKLAYVNEEGKLICQDMETGSEEEVLEGASLLGSDGEKIVVYTRDKRKGYLRECPPTGGIELKSLELRSQIEVEHNFFKDPMLGTVIMKDDFELLVAYEYNYAEAFVGHRRVWIEVGAKVVGIAGNYIVYLYGDNIYGARIDAIKNLEWCDDSAPISCSVKLLDAEVEWENVWAYGDKIALYVGNQVKLYEVGKKLREVYSKNADYALRVSLTSDKYDIIYVDEGPEQSQLIVFNGDGAVVNYLEGGSLAAMPASPTSLWRLTSEGFEVLGFPTLKKLKRMRNAN
jgi:hypothetical protein